MKIGYKDSALKYSAFIPVLQARSLNSIYLPFPSNLWIHCILEACKITLLSLYVGGPAVSNFEQYDWCWWYLVWTSCYVKWCVYLTMLWLATIV